MTAFDKGMCSNSTGFQSGKAAAKSWLDKRIGEDGDAVRCPAVFLCDDVDAIDQYLHDCLDGEMHPGPGSFDFRMGFISTVEEGLSALDLQSQKDADMATVQSGLNGDRQVFLAYPMLDIDRSQFPVQRCYHRLDWTMTTRATAAHLGSMFGVSDMTAEKMLGWEDGTTRSLIDMESGKLVGTIWADISRLHPNYTAAVDALATDEELVRFYDGMGVDVADVTFLSSFTCGFIRALQTWQRATPGHWGGDLAKTLGQMRLAHESPFCPNQVELSVVHGPDQDVIEAMFGSMVFTTQIPNADKRACEIEGALICERIRLYATVLGIAYRVVPAHPETAARAQLPGRFKRADSSDLIEVLERADRDDAGE